MVKLYTAQFDAAFGALAHPVRRAIVARLAEEGPVNATDLAEPFDVSLPAVSKHIRVLERAGLLEQERDGRVRRCRLNAAPLAKVSRWVEQYRQFWERRLGSLADYFEPLNNEEPTDERNG